MGNYGLAQKIDVFLDIRAEGLAKWSGGMPARNRPVASTASAMVFYRIFLVTPKRFRLFCIEVYVSKSSGPVFRPPQG